MLGGMLVSEAGRACTLHSDLGELRPTPVSLDLLCTDICEIADRWGIDGASSVVLSALSLICEAKTGATVIVGLEDGLRELEIQDMDGGYMDERTQDLGIGSPALRQAFLDFTDPSFTDSETGKWACSYHDLRAHGKTKKGAWLVTAKGGRLKAAALLLGLKPAPYKLVDKGLRHTITLMAACTGFNISLIRSDAGMVHAFAVPPGCDATDVRAWCLPKEMVAPFEPLQLTGRIQQLPAMVVCPTLLPHMNSGSLHVEPCTESGECKRGVSPRGGLAKSYAAARLPPLLGASRGAPELPRECPRAAPLGCGGGLVGDEGDNGYTART